MSNYKKLPADYAIDACSIEADGRGTSYGKLVAATTREEREKLAEEYRMSFERGGRGGTKSIFTRRKKDDIADLRRKNEKLRSTESEMAPQ